MFKELRIFLNCMVQLVYEHYLNICFEVLV